MIYSSGKTKLPIVIDITVIGNTDILIGCVYSELFDGYIRIILTSLTVICNDSDIT